MKVIGMIPARLGSKRVPKKNLRIIDGKPLIMYVIETVKKCLCFDEIYLNSESDIFERIALDNNISFYKRPPEYASDKATNDGFAYDFMSKINGDILIQILPTSPLISDIEVTGFVDEMVKKKWDTLISVEHKQIACVYDNKPLNFDKLKINPLSQLMVPVMAYATVLMAWKYDAYMKNMKKYGAAYHGGDGKTGYYELRGLSTIDIDREKDFELVERIIISSKYKKQINKIYYEER